VERVRDLPDDEQWIRDRRRAIGQRIREMREEQKLTQDDLYLAARISRGTYQRVEYGEEVTLGTLLRIAWVLDVPLAELLR
jgi:transcriptional regulator with XRE-family HTH domain